MPYVHVQITDEQVTKEQKAQIIKEMTEVLVRVLKKNPATTHVVIEEVPTDNWGVGGVTVTELRRRK